MSLDIMAAPRSAALLAKANPLSKLAAAAVITIALVIIVDWVSSTTALVLELLLFPLAGLSLGTFLRRGWPILLAAIVSGYGTALLAPKTGAVLLDWGPFLFTTGSVESGIAIALRGLAIALPSIMMLACTDPTDLADALAQKLRLPARFVLGALAAMRLVGLLVAEWQTLGMARRARGVGGEPGFFSGLRGGLGQALALLVQAIRRASRLAVTMEAKGFGAGPRTWARESVFTRIDVWVILGGVLLAAVAVGASLASGAWNPTFS